MRHALIMAGGSGTRLWPLSRRSRPKQLLRLFDGASLLQHARRRLENVFPPENIWVITSAEYINSVANELHDIPRQNLIGEPMGRNTANAVGMGAMLIARRDPDATMGVFTADHLISPQDEFEAAIDLGLSAAEQFPESLVTFGITPDKPNTEFGYVQRGEPVGESAYKVEAFKEKPDEQTARRYVESGEYFWNSGMFAWRVSAILAELERCLPENYRELNALADDWGHIVGTSALAERFGQLKKISVDYGVMERARNVLTVEMDCRWLDLGSWSAVAGLREPGDDGNVVIAPHTLIVDGRNNIVASESNQLLVIAGVSDLIIVQGADATLICPREFEQQIRELTELRREKFGERFE